MRRLLGFCAVLTAILVAFAALRFRHTPTVSAAGASSNLSLTGVPMLPGCPLDPIFTFCDQVLDSQGPAVSFTVTATMALTNLRYDPTTGPLVAIPGLSSNFNANQADFTIASNGCLGNLAANAKCFIDIAFAPMAAGLRQAALKMIDDQGDIFLIDMEGRGSNLAIVPPTPLSDSNCGTGDLHQQDNAFTFCNRAVGSGGNPEVESFTITPGTVSGLTVSIAPIVALSSEFASEDFSVVGSPVCTSTSCQVNVSFTPTVPGLRSAAVTATDSGGDSTSVYVAGNASSDLAFPSPLSVSTSTSCPRLLNFGFCNEPVGGTSQAAVLLLENTSAAVSITGLSIPSGSTTADSNTSADFTVKSTTCSSTLAPNASCAINVAFTPQATGLRQGGIVVTDLGGDVAGLNLAGVGDDYQLQLANGQTSEESVAQGNSITFNAQVAASDSAFGINGEQVALQCPANIPEFASCTITPCPGPVAANSTTSYKIVFATTSPTMAMPVPVPPVSNPAGCTGYGGPATSGLITPQGRGPSLTGARDALAQPMYFPALAGLLLLASVTPACGYRRSSSLMAALKAAFGSRRFASVLLTFAFAAMVATALGGCHHKTNTVLGTPAGQTTMIIQGVAYDSNGNSLNAARGLPMITLDVVAQ